jgi:arylsulfatase A-like enzyme
MLNHDFDRMLDYLTELGVGGNTIVVFAEDNGPEDHLLGRGTAGFFDGSYFSSAEGGIRTPCLIRWPGRVSVRESNEMVHVTDMFTTLVKWAGCEPPSDRVIAGIDQQDFFSGAETSNREGSPVWFNEQLHAVKWSQFKVSFKRQQHFHDPRSRSASPASSTFSKTRRSVSPSTRRSCSDGSCSTPGA